MAIKLGNKVNVVGLRKLFNDQKNPAAKVILEYLAGRTNCSWSVSVDSMVWKIHGSQPSVSRSEIVSVFQSLADLGCGKFIVGRRGAASRFEWAVHMASIGRVAIGEVSEVEELTGDESEEDSVDMVSHVYRLRSELVIPIPLPSDFTAYEAERLAQYIKSLPLNPETPKDSKERS